MLAWKILYDMRKICTARFSQCLKHRFSSIPRLRLSFYIGARPGILPRQSLQVSWWLLHSNGTNGAEWFVEGSHHQRRDLWQNSHPPAEQGDEVGASDPCWALRPSEATKVIAWEPFHGRRNPRRPSKIILRTLRNHFLLVFSNSLFKINTWQTMWLNFVR